jgi:hypothetical protein
MQRPGFSNPLSGDFDHGSICERDPASVPVRRHEGIKPGELHLMRDVQQEDR